MISLLSDRFPHLLIGIKVAKSGEAVLFLWIRECPEKNQSS